MRWSYVAVVLCPFLLGAGCGGADVCSRSAEASKWCGGDPTSADHATCDPSVATACTSAEQHSYEQFLSCAVERCRDHSPDRQISASCDPYLAAVSAGCYAAGLVGNADYRDCGGTDPDTCLTQYGYTCFTAPFFTCGRP